MTDRLYTGLVHKQLRGNRDDALTLEREARIKVGYLFDSMMKGQTFKTGSWSLGDERKIMAFVWNDVLGKRATVRLTGVGGEREVPTILFDTGWLTWEDGHFTVNVWEELAAFYQETGYGTGCLQLPAPNIIDAAYDSAFQGRDTPPEADPIDASWFSGLGRLFVQSIHGAGRSWANDFAAALPTWTFGPAINCIRSPDGVYWLTYTTESDGVQAARLVQSDAIQCLAASDVVAGFTQEITDALVLGYSTVSSEIVTVVDPSANEWIDVYAGGHEPLIWWWCWRFQKRGASDEHQCGAIICTHKFELDHTDAYTAHYIEAKLDITFDETGLPIGAVAITRQGYFPAIGGLAPAVCVLGNDGSITQKFSPALIVDTHTPASQLGVVASWYLPSGEISSCEYRGKLGLYNIPEATETWGNCVPCENNNSAYGQKTVVKCGNFYVNETHPLNVYNSIFFWSQTYEAVTIVERRENGGLNVLADYSDYTRVDTGETIPAPAVYFSNSPGVIWLFGIFEMGYTETTTTWNEVVETDYTNCACDSYIMMSWLLDTLSGVTSGYPNGVVRDTHIVDNVIKVRLVVNDNYWDYGEGTAEYDFFNQVWNETLFWYDFDATALTELYVKDKLSWGERGNVTGMPPAAGFPAGALDLVGTWVGAA